MDKEKLKRELYNLASSDQYARLFLSVEDPELFSCSVDDIKYVLRLLVEILTQNLLSFDENCELETIINKFAGLNKYKPFEEFEKECPEYYEKIVEKLRIENEKHKVSELYDY